MEDQTLDTGFSDNLNFSTVIQNSLHSAARWAKFIAILGFIGVGFMVIGAISLGVMFATTGNNLGSEFGAFGNLPAVLGPIFYLVIAAIYFFPVYFLYQFSSKTLRSIASKSQLNLEEAIFNLKRHYKFIGIYIIVSVGIYILVLLGVLMFGLANM